MSNNDSNLSAELRLIRRGCNFPVDRTIRTV